MLNLESQEFFGKNPIIESYSRIDRLPIAAPSLERAVVTARKLLLAFQNGLTDDEYTALIESAWRAARGPSRWVLAAPGKIAMSRAIEDFILEGRCAAAGNRRVTPRRTVFVFSGMGPQWSGMGRELARKLPRFSEYVDEIDLLFVKYVGFSVWEELSRHKDAEELPAALAQTGNFLIQAALYKLLVDENIVPDAILGHSAGEVAAAYAAGVYSLEEAVRVAGTRGKLQAILQGRGSMLAVGMGRKEVIKYIARVPGISIAAINDDSSVTISGGSLAIKKCEKLLQEQQVFTKRLRVDVPYHSPVMDEITKSITSKLNFLKPSEANVALYSTVSGERSSGREWDAGYWACNIRQPVLFADAIKSVLGEGGNCLIEIAPHPVLSQSIKTIIDESSDVTVHHIMSRKDDEYELFVSRLSELAIDSVGRPPRRRSAPLIGPEYEPQQLWDEDSEAKSQRRGDWVSEELRLLGRRVSSIVPNFEMELSITDFPWMKGHAVQGLGTIIPATLWAELITLAVSEGEQKQVQLANLTIIQSLPVTESQTIISTKIEGGIVKCLSRAAGKTPSWTLHAQASITSMTNLVAKESNATAVKTLPPVKGTKVDIDSLYQLFQTKGLYYTRHFQNLTEVTIGEGNEAWAVIDGKEYFSAGYHSPWVLDAGLQLLIAAAKDWGEVMYLPFRIGHVNLQHPMIDSGDYQAHAEVTVRNGSELIGTVRFFDNDGLLLAELNEITCIRNLSDDIERNNYIDRNIYTLRNLTYDEMEETYYIAGQEQDAPDSGTVEEKQEVAEETSEYNLEYWVTEIERDAEQHVLPFKRPYLDLSSIGNQSKAHLLWMLPNQELESDVLIVTSLIQRIGQLGNRSLTLTFICSRGQDWIFGLRRSAANSYGFSIRVIMRDATTTSEMLEAAVALTQEHEIIFEGNKPLLRRLEKVTGQLLRSLDSCDRATEKSLKETTLAFDFVRGQLNRLVTIRERLRKPGPGEVCIEVEATGLMWKDVGKILGTIGNATVHTFSRNHLGFGVSGTVVEVGPDACFSVGERIFGGLHRPYRRRITLDATAARLLRRVPEGIEGVTAVAHSVPWITALTAFDRAKPQSGEKVFIQSGAGSVGSVLCLYAMQQGAHVVTSVGTAKKVADVKRMLPGVEVVVARGAEVPDVLYGSGYNNFDWIIATVNGITRSSLMTLLNNRGHYIDLGKPASVDETFLTNFFDGNKRYHVVDIDQLSAQVPGWLEEQLDMLVEKYSDPANLVPVTCYSINQMPQALHDLAQGETTGCVAIEMVPGYSPEAAYAMYHTMDPNGYYLITGGYGAVGLICAHWLASRGARHIVLSGSSGKPTEASQASIELLKAGGVEVRVAKSDTTDRASMEQLLAQIKGDGCALRGVIHTAGMISDGPFEQIDEERIARSFGAKLEGAYYLADALQAVDGFEDLEFFVLTSSISSLVGLSIQGTYASANAGLDGFAEDLRARGVNACALQLGPIGQRGMAADGNVQRYYTTIGLSPMSSRRMYGILDLAVAVNVPHFVVDEVDWARNSRAEPANATSSVLRNIIAEALSDTGRDELENLLSLDHKGRAEVLTIMLLGIFAEALGLEEECLSAESNFSAMGIDSLAIMEVQAGINEVLRQDLPLARMFTQDGTIGEMADRLSEYLGENVDETEEAA
jgi:NADPH:quinone reductase-like Zn-dependent oxidoreductase/malonyl CoA-acyl carrier protein transacylase